MNPNEIIDEKISYNLKRTVDENTNISYTLKYNNSVITGGILSLNKLNYQHKTGNEHTTSLHFSP